MARRNLIESKEKSKANYDKKINPKTFKKGDYVFLQKGPKAKKLEDQFSGPYEIVEVLGKGNVKIKMKKDAKVVHENRLKHSYMAPV